MYFTQIGIILICPESGYLDKTKALYVIAPLLHSSIITYLYDSKNIAENMDVIIISPWQNMNVLTTYQTTKMLF